MWASYCMLAINSGLLIGIISGGIIYGISVAVGGVILVSVLICTISERHRSFVNKANLISKGKTFDEVLDLMGHETSKEKIDGKTIMVWEKRQWKGLLYGGTLTRSVKVFFDKNDKVVFVSTKNLDKPIYL